MKMDIETVISELKLDRSNWSLTTFGDVAIQQKESVDRENTDITRYVKGEHMYSEDLHLREWGELEDEYLGPAFIRKFEEGDILYGSRRTYLRKVCIAPFEGITANTTFVIKANEDLIDKRLLPFVMLSEGFSEHSIRNSKGSVNPYVNWKDIANYEFLLPPKEMQAQLTELLWAADSALEEVCCVKQKVDLLIEAIFKDRCRLVAGCVQYQVKELLIDGPRNGFSPKSSSDGEGVKTVSIGAVKGGRFTPEGNLKYAKVDDAIWKKFDVQDGDVFVVRGNGNKDLCGRAGLATKSYSNMFYPDLLIRLRFDLAVILPEFAAFQWNSLKAHKNLLKWAKSTNGIWKVNGDDVKRHKLMAPPIAEQKKIMEEIANIDSRLLHCNAAVKDTNQLRKSLINQVF